MGAEGSITEGASGAVGMLDDPQFTATQLFLANGDSLVLYTDGVVEAAAVDGSLFGDERLAACLQGVGSRPAAISERILQSVAQHTLTAPASDDLTIFICHLAAGAPLVSAFALDSGRQCGPRRLPEIPAFPSTGKC